MKRELPVYNFLLIVLLLILMRIVIADQMPEQENKYFHVGIAVYDMNDPYMKDYSRHIQEQLEEYSCAGKKVLYEILDAEGDTNRQQKQLQYLCAQNFDALLINLVNPTSAAGILNDASDHDIPVILFNRETDAKNLTISDNFWYVGSDAKAAGAIQGDMLTVLWKERNAEVDRNRNGKLDYVLVEGEETNFDAVRRTNGFLEHSSDTNLHQLKNISADWQRTMAYDEFSMLDKEIIENTEAVICHNDNMALGIYDFYKTKQMEIPVILGIDNHSEITAKIESGEIYGTVDGEIEEQVTYICELLDGILRGETDTFEKVWYSTPHAVVNE